jgi:hypothetical protein
LTFRTPLLAQLTALLARLDELAHQATDKGDTQRERYVYVDDNFINAELVRLGWPEAREYLLDTQFAERYSQLAAEARSANIGCYALGMFGGSRSVQPAPTNPPS